MSPKYRRLAPITASLRIAFWLSCSLALPPRMNTPIVSSKSNSQNGSSRVLMSMTSAMSGNAREYSLCASISTTWPWGCCVSTARRIRATVQLLPEPVVPSTAMCLPSNGSVIR